MIKLNIVTLLLIFSLFSCAQKPVSTTINPITKEEISSINNLAVFVNFEDYSIIYSEYTSKLPVSHTFSGLIAELILVPVFVYLDEKSDRELTEKSQTGLKEHDLNKRFSSTLQTKLQSSIPEINIEVIESKNPYDIKNSGFDSILEVQLDELTMIPCTDRDSIDKVKDTESRLKYMQVNNEKDKLLGDYISPIKKHDNTEEQMRNYDKELMKLRKARVHLESQLELTAIITNIRSNNELWSRKEVYNTKCHTLYDVESNPNKMIENLSNAINQIATSTLNNLQQ